jgi:hypothetical protein
MNSVAARVQLLKPYLVGLNIEIRTTLAGFGLFATRNINAGEVIFMEPKLILSVTHQDPFVRHLGIARDLVLKPENKVFLSLLQSSHKLPEAVLLKLEKEEKELQQAFRVIQRNVFDENDKEGEKKSWLGLVSSCVNHSCVPNTCFINQTAVALTFIPKGAEITVTCGATWP